MRGGGNLTLGYIENKRVNADFLRLIDESNKNPREQLAKYLTLSPNLILTDYLRFLRLEKTQDDKIKIIQEVKICALDEITILLKDKSKLESKQQELLEFFTLFFSSTPKPIATAQEFALCLAQRTRLLKDALIDNSQNPQISALYQSFRDILYKDLDFEAFCDSFAQTLTYALFLARLNDEKGEIIDLYNAKKFIPKSFPLIRAMSGFLDNLDELDSLKWLIKEILGIINHIDPSSITKELNKIADKDLLGNYLHKDPYLHFYETFLSQYDLKLRESRGVYYTPFPIVKFIIDSIDFVLKHDFSQDKGLGSALSNDNITLLDFATGTGTFLLEAFCKALDSTPPNSLHYKPKNLLPKFSGFEFLIAPYTIAHLKISQSFKEEFHAPLEDNEKLNILLTNTIYTKSAKDEQNQKSNLLGMYELAQEFLQSQKLKNEQILIITGNPPYSGASANKGIFEDEVKIAYGLEPSLQKLNKEEQKQIDNYFNPNISGEKFKQAKKTFKTLFEQRKLKDEKNPKWLLDDYMKFIHFAESKVQAQEQGIVAIITNHGFIDNITFRGARAHLLNTFDKIYILDLHGNVKKKEKALDSSKDDNVFDIQQGVSINIFVKTGQKEQDSLAQVYHYDLFGKRQDKYNFLLENDLQSVQWKVFTPEYPYYLFFSYNKALFKEYVQYRSIKDIFKSVGVGITTAHDDFVIDSDKERLLQKFNDFRDSPPNASELHKKFNVKQKDGWDILKGWKNLQGKSNLQQYIKKIAYRPFDMRYIFYEEKLVWRCVKDIMQHFDAQDNLGLNVARQSKIQGSWQYVTITNSLVDFSLMGGGNTGAGYIFPLYLVQSDSDESCHSQGSKRPKNPNKNNKISLDSSLNAAHFAQNDKNIKAHNDKAMLVENFTKSFRAFIDTKYEQRFAPEVILGYIYAVLFHKDYREKYIDFLKIDFPRIPFVKSKEKFLALSALGSEIIALHLKKDTALNESVGQDALIDENTKDLTIQNFSYVAQEKRLFINKNLYFTNVSKEVWEYKIGGYQVLYTYLSYHKNEQINKDFREIIKILHKSLEIEAKIAKISIF